MKAVALVGFSGFLHLLQLTSHDLAAVWQKSDYNRNAKTSVSSRNKKEPQPQQYSVLN